MTAAIHGVLPAMALAAAYAAAILCPTRSMMTGKGRRRVVENADA
jgi:hypothetical protein